MRRKPEDHFIGYWKHNVGGWEICYKKGGKKYSEYRRDETEAKLRAEFWKASLENPPSQESDEEHPVHYWERKLREVAELAISNPSDKDIANTCKAVAMAAGAAMRAARYIPAPVTSVAPNGAPITGDINSLTTEQLESLNGTNDMADKADAPVG